jgi:hypothetical protein
LESSSRSWVGAKSLMWALFVVSLSLTTGWLVFSLTLWGIPSLGQFLYASGLGLVSGFSVFALLFGSKYVYLRFFIDAGFDSSESANESIIEAGSLDPEGSSLAEGSPSAEGYPMAEGSLPQPALKSQSIAKCYASSHCDEGLPIRDFKEKTPIKEAPTKDAILAVASLTSNKKAAMATSSHQLQTVKKTEQTTAALSEPSGLKPIAMSVSQATIERSHLTLVAPLVWSAGLIKMLEWRVFDRLSVTYWAQQGYKILGIKMGLYRRNKFFVCAAGNKKIKIAVVQSHSAWSSPISKVEMQYLIKIKEASNAKAAILMHSGHLSNVVRSFCISKNIRLLNQHNISKGLLALPLALQDQMLDQLVKDDYMVPTCPNCSTKMKHRRHKTTGNQVWGCRSYPACRIMINYYTG